MTAVAFAESGEVEEARRLVGKKETRYIQKENTLAGFLEKVGLEGAHISTVLFPSAPDRVTYGPESSFCRK